MGRLVDDALDPSRRGSAPARVYGALPHSEVLALGLADDVFELSSSALFRVPQVSERRAHLLSVHRFLVRDNEAVGLPLLLRLVAKPAAQRGPLIDASRLGWAR